MEGQSRAQSYRVAQNGARRLVSIIPVMLVKALPTAPARADPACVSVTFRCARANSAVLRSSYSTLIWRLTAACLIPSPAVARVKLPTRAAAPPDLVSRLDLRRV